MANSSNGDFVLGVLMGAAIGVTAGLLFAPRSGEESRDILQQKVSDLRERAVDFVEAVKEDINKKPA